MKTFTNLVDNFKDLTSNETPANISRGKQFINDAHKFYNRKYYSDMKTVTINTVANQILYPFPADYKTFREAYIMVGAQKWVLQEVKTRAQYDDLSFIQYTSSLPQYIYLDESTKSFAVFPVTATSNFPIYFNYKYTLPDLTLSDITTGTATVTNGSKTVTLSSSLLNSGYAVNCFFRIQPENGGDGVWYLIQSVDSATQVTLYQPYGGTTGNNSYTIGQMPYLDSDFHDILQYRPLRIYFQSILKDAERYKMYKDLEDEIDNKLDEFAGNKSTGVDLSLDAPSFNPNNFLMY